MSLVDRLNPTTVLQRFGAFQALPQALARVNGAMQLTRLAIERVPAPVAPSPYEVIDAIGAAKLLCFAPKSRPLDQAPILLCPSLINRLYVLDLKEGISLVDVLLQAGHPVYGIDWGDPGAAEQGVTLEEFTTGRLRHFVAAAADHAHVAKISVLGHCLGGTMAAALAAVDDARIQSLVLLTAPLDFHDRGVLSAWTRAPFFDPRIVVDAVGHVPGWVTQPAFQILRPLGQPVKTLRLLQSLGNPQFLDFFRCLETWINDNVAIPDAFFVDLVEKLYQQNALARGELRFAEGPVVLEEIRVPTLAIAAESDHIVPVSSAIDPVARFASKTKRTEVLDGGHIGVVVGGLARRRLWPLLLSWLQEQDRKPVRAVA